MIGEQRLANAVDGLMPGEDIAAVFAAARKARNSWVAVAVAVWFFFVFFGPSGSSALSGALLGTAAGAVAMGFVVLVRPSPVVVAVTAESLVVIEMGKLRNRRAVRVRSRSPRSTTPITATPSELR